WPAGVIGVTFRRMSATGVILEADIALNPAFRFTLNDEAMYNGLFGVGVQPFRLTMLHELGHMHGMNHQFWFLSVMNYAPQVFRCFGLPYTDDAKGIRWNYPARTVPRRDLAVYLWQSNFSTNWTDATYPLFLRRGQFFVINNYHVENVGTAAIAR